jgi:hypothetical protein
MEEKMAQINQDMSGYDTQEGFEPLKAGWYEAVIQDSEIKKGPAGPYINWQFGIVGHPNKIWDVMSLGNSVSMQRLKTLCKCCGHPNPNYLADTEEIHGNRCLIRLKIEIDESGQYDPKNKISAFKSLETAPTLPPQQPEAEPPTGTVPPPSQIDAAQPSVPQEQAKMPWE